MKKRNRFAYAKKRAVISPLPIESLLPVDSITWKLFQDCRVSLEVFLECLFDKDYSGLTIAGNPPEHKITEAWGKIYVEYAELLNEGSGNELYNKTIEINYISAKIFAIDKCIKHFHISYNEDLKNILEYYGVNERLSPEDTREERFKKLEVVIAKSKRWITQLEILRKEFDAMTDEETESTGGRGQFEDNLSNLSSWNKYAVISRNISVRQYVKMLKGMNREYQKLLAKTA